MCSCSYDGTVIVWKELEHAWKIEYEYKEHTKSGAQNLFILITIIDNNYQQVNTVSWGPQELGLILACGSSDGNVSILRFKGSNIPIINIMI